MSNAPIIFFAYSRHQSARRALNSLHANDLASESDLYIFSDGPRPGASEAIIEDINQTRKVIREKQWCGNVYISESENNKGLARSVIEGVSAIAEKYGRVIVIEDDALLSPWFLRFMNDSLDIYKDDEKVFGMGGWTYFPKKGKLKEPFFLRYPDSLAWAVYNRSWKFFIKDAALARKELIDRNLMHLFNPFETLHFFDSMLNDQINGKIDSWAIRWTATTIINNGLILYPPVSMAKNMGNTGGTHEMVKDYNSTLQIADKRLTVRKQQIEENEIAFNEWKRFARIHFLNDSSKDRLMSKVRQLAPQSLKTLIRSMRGRKIQLSPGDFLTVEPASRTFGFDRGTPIDRYYIEKFLSSNKKLIKGKVLEIGESYYSSKYSENITSMEVFGFQADQGATVTGDLSNHDSLPENFADCFICTQTLNFIYDHKSALTGCYKILKPGGVLLLTVAGICQISQYDNKRWGDYWRYTPASIKRMADEIFGSEAVQIFQYGNSHAAVMLLKGFAAEETTAEKLDYIDEDYPVTICLAAIKRNVL